MRKMIGFRFQCRNDMYEIKSNIKSRLRIRIRVNDANKSNADDKVSTRLQRRERALYSIREYLVFNLQLKEICLIFLII